MHTIANEFSLIGKLTQKCHSYKETFEWWGSISMKLCYANKDHPKNKNQKSNEQIKKKATLQSLAGYDQ